MTVFALQVPLSDVWVSTCISDVSEVTLDPTTSFVIGWPINNAVLTFRWPLITNIFTINSKYFYSGYATLLTQVKVVFFFIKIFPKVYYEGRQQLSCWCRNKFYWTLVMSRKKVHLIFVSKLLDRLVLFDLYLHLTFSIISGVSA